VKIKIYLITISNILCGHETWSLSSREEHTLKMFENSVEGIFGSEREEELGIWI
jgi:hypothetical protein